MSDTDLRNKLAIIVASAPFDRADEFVMPLVYATVAAAMECEVEVHFTGRAVRLLVAGVAAGLDAGDGKTVYAHVHEAAQHGARLLACSKALKQHVAAGEAMIAEFGGGGGGGGGVAGAATVVMRSLDPEWRVLCF